MKKVLFAICAVISITTIAQPSFLGMNNSLAKHWNGNIFSVDVANNSMQTEYDFFMFEGSSYKGTLIEFNNKLYGVTSQGNGHFTGVIYSYDLSSGNYEQHYQFNNATNGSGPRAGMILVNNKLYGTTYGGGVNLDGVIFEFDPATNQYTKLHDFDNTNGKGPLGALLHASNGLLYGMTQYGGANADGVVFSYNLSTSTFTKLQDLVASTTGERPSGALMQASNGLLYGLTEFGGSNSQGTMFTFNTNTNNFSVIHHFASGQPDNPEGTLFEASNGKLYGIAGGEIFEWNITTSTFTKKVAAGSNLSLYGDFIEPTTGMLYALGQNQRIINYDLAMDTLGLAANPNYTSINNNYGSNTATHGRLSTGSIVKASNNKLYGVSYDGGIAGDGVFFEFDMALDSMSTKFHFGESEANQANGVLIKASNGKYYGCSREGGNDNEGVFFEFDESTRTYRTVYHFHDSIGAVKPVNLLEENGVIYGLGSGIFKNLSGNRFIIFKYNVAQDSVSFSAKTLGSLAFAGPASQGFIKATNGHLYALSSSSIIHYDISTDSIIIDHSFSGISDVRDCRGRLMQASNGLLYGTSRSGGVYRDGTFFSYDIVADTAHIEQSLYPGIGEASTSTPVQAGNGKIYFTAYEGGNYSDGTMLEHDPISRTTVRKQNFRSSTTGKWPSGHMTLASDGNIYGLITGGVSGGFSGSVYKYQPGTTNITTVVSYMSTEGDPFVNNGLLEYTRTFTTIEDKRVEENLFSMFPNPSRSTLNINSENIIESVHILNLLGQTVFEHEYNQNQVKINLESIPNGNYVVVVNRRKAQKLIIQH